MSEFFEGEIHSKDSAASVVRGDLVGFPLSAGISSLAGAKAVCGLGFLVWGGVRGSVWSRDLAAPAPGHSTQLHKQTCGFIEGASNSPQLVCSAFC